MTYFNRGGNFGGGSNRGGYDRSERPEMHKAICEECGKDCEVPFRPNGSRPIYCSSCFEARGGGNSDRNQGGNRFESRPRFNEAPRRDFEGRNDGPRQTMPSTSPNYRDEFLALNRKIDRIMDILEKKDSPKKEAPKNEFFETILEESKAAPKKAKKKTVKK